MSSVATKNSWIYMNAVDPEAERYLFCFPYAGGTAQVFNRWQAAFTQPRTGIQVCAVQYPGRGNRMREAPFTDCRLLVQHLLPHMLPLLDKPFALFGHSMGAIIAFEVTRALRGEWGLEPARLFVSGRRAPQVPARGPHVYTLPDDELAEKLRELNGTPREVLENAELMQLVLRTIRGDLAVTETYVYTEESLLTCPISVFEGSNDPDVNHADLAAWSEQTTGACSLRTFEGDHFFIQSSEAALLQAISQDLSCS